MNISGKWTTSVIISQIKRLKKLKIINQTCQNSWSQSDGVTNTRNYNFNQFYAKNVDGLENATNQLKYNLATCAIGDSLVQQQWHSPSSRNLKIDFY